MGKGTNTALLVIGGLGVGYLLAPKSVKAAVGAVIPAAPGDINLDLAGLIGGITLPGSGSGGGGLRFPSVPAPAPSIAPDLDSVLGPLFGLFNNVLDRIPEVLPGQSEPTSEVAPGPLPFWVGTLNDLGDAAAAPWWAAITQEEARIEHALARQARLETEAQATLQEEANIDEIAEFNLGVFEYNEAIEEETEATVREDYEETLEEQGFLMAIPFVREISSWFFWTFGGKDIVAPLKKTPLPTQEEEE